MGPLWYIQIAEHADCTMDDNGLTNTRTVRSNWLIRFTYFNMNFHAEHHLYPMFPFHALPRAHELLKHKLQKITPTYREINSDVLSKYIPLQIAQELIVA